MAHPTNPPSTATITNDGVVVTAAPGLILPDPTQKQDAAKVEAPAKVESEKKVDAPKVDDKVEEPDIDFSAFTDAKSLVPKEFLPKPEEKKTEVVPTVPPTDK